MSISLPFKPGWRVVELGGGETPLKLDGIHVTNVDARPLPTVDIVRNLEDDFSDIGKWDGLYASYIAEHISWRRLPTFFKSCYNILNPGGAAVFIVPNTLEQVLHLAKKPDWGLEDSCLLFGDQDYPENSHRSAFTPQLISKLLRDAGFSRVEIYDHPNPECFDMVVHAYKEKQGDEYGVDYFYGVYTGTGYRDFPAHQKTVEEILKRNPESVLDVGGARGYVVKHLEACGVKAVCLDVSKHCFHTRATKSFIRADATEPLPFKDGEFDLAFSCAFLEHIPESKVPDVIRELARVSRRGLHGITFTVTDVDVDHTHLSGTIRPREWWLEQFEKYAPGYPVEVVDKEELERPPIVVPQADDGLVKINAGCFTEMFYYNWINADILDLSDFARQNGYRFKVMDFSKPLPLEDCSVDYIVAHHLIEHLTREEGRLFASECFRVLKPGGGLRLSVPDLATLAGMYLDGVIGELRHLSKTVGESRDDADAFWSLLTSGHKTAYDAKSLRILLEEAGFTVYDSEFDKSRFPVVQRETIDSFPTISVYIDAVKPLGQGEALKRYLEA